MRDEVNEIPISGRFGNQLFQLCAALYLQKSNGKRILLDARGTRPSNLILLWKSGIVSREEIRLSRYQKNYLSGVIWARYFEWIQRLMEFVSYRLKGYIKFDWIGNPFKKKVEYISDKDWPSLLTRTKNRYGYFQDWALIEEVWGQLKARFFRSNLVDSKYTLEESVLLHVRLGDFFYHKAIGVLSETYYQEAIKSFPENFHFYVVTDDEANFYKHFHNLSINVVVNPVTNDDFETFKLLVNSKNLIIANSTFSYWAGIFSCMIDGQNKVIAPYPWRHDQAKDEILPTIFKLISRSS